MANAGQMTQSTYLDIDGLPDRVTALETGSATAAALTSEIEAREAADTKQLKCLADLLNGKAKNLAHFMYDGGTWYKITFDVNNAKGMLTISTDGASSGYKGFRILGNSADSVGWEYGIPIPRGTYKLLGLPSGASSSTFRYLLGIATSSSATRQPLSIYSDYEFTVSNDTTRIDLSAYVAQGANISSISILPYLVRKEAYEIAPDFQPWYPDLSELWAKVMALGGSPRSVSNTRNNEAQEEQR